AYAYCDSCGHTAFFSVWSPIPDGLSLRFHGCINQDIEPWLDGSSFGGRLRADASPRCPHCRHALSGGIATGYLEANAPGTAKGWWWWRNWHAFMASSLKDAASRHPGNHGLNHPDALALASSSSRYPCHWTFVF